MFKDFAKNIFLNFIYYDLRCNNLSISFKVNWGTESRVRLLKDVTVVVVADDFSRDLTHYCDKKNRSCVSSPC